MNSAPKATPIVLTITQLTKAIKLHLEGAFRIVMVKGEVSNLKVQSSGHVYFTLKDEAAQIACVLFFQDAKKVKSPLKMGDKITVRGELTVYEARGNYQIIVREVSVDGLGEQLVKLEELKQALKAKGYFDSERKKKLPHFPNRIGVVTSQTGAVIRDIIHVLTRRLHGFHLILNPVRVQGEGAAEEIALAIDQMNAFKLADVIIVGRGGGSFEELSCFNDIRVANAIFNSQIPIVSAVGHETDTTISDLVADVRAPTPSAAAEIISQEKHKLLEELQKYQKSCTLRLLQQLAQKKEQLARAYRHPLFHIYDLLTRTPQQKLDDIKDRLDLAVLTVLQTRKERLALMRRSTDAARPTTKLSQHMQRLLGFERALNTALENKLAALKTSLLAKQALTDKTILNKLQNMKNVLRSKNFSETIPKRLIQAMTVRHDKLVNMKRHLGSVNPKKLLQRGYSILFSEKDGAVITTAAALQVHDRVNIQFFDSKASAQITSITKEI